MHFRQDINGLRAIAVILVVVFHFDRSLLPGGFVGVDVFFVISGFLMTGIILKGLDNSNFSLLSFYFSRAQRIIPALAFLCLVLSIYAWFNFYNTELKTLVSHLFGSLFFYSNIVYWQEAGYFTASAHQNWLLHTWSLSVEWQFYIIYPIALGIIMKISNLRILKYLILTGFILSLCLSVYASRIWPDPAYFSLPTRAWQMLLGSLAYLFPLVLTIRHKALLQYFGITLIVSSAFYVQGDMDWPSFYALFPTLGAYFVLLANRNENIILNNKLSSYLGVWSYSIYLWHWPIVVFVYNLSAIPSFFELLVGLTAALLLGMVSFYCVEKGNRTKKLIVFFFLASANVLVLDHFKYGSTPYRPISNAAGNIFLNKAEEELKKAKISNLCNASNNFNSELGTVKLPESCINWDSQSGIFIWGDSHANALVHGIKHFYQPLMPVNHLFSSGCRPSFTEKVGSSSLFRRACDASNKIAYEAIKEIKPSVVILGQQKEHHKNDWITTYRILKQMGIRHVILVGPVPQWHPSLALAYAKAGATGNKLTTPHFDLNIPETDLKVIENVTNYPDLHYVSPYREFCLEDEFSDIVCEVIFDGQLITFDYGHLSPKASEELAERLIKPKIDELL